jgi:ribosomal protein L7/L12
MTADLLARIEALEAQVARLYELMGEPAPARPEAGGPAAGGQTGGNDFPPEVVQLALEGNKIGAIKVLRERTGLSLGDAKTVVDSIG